MTNFRNRFLILIFEKEKSLPITVHVTALPNQKFFCLFDVCSRKAALYKHLYFGPLVLFFDSSTPGVDGVDGLSSTPKRNTKFERK
jgi:hypothetical protein